MGEAVALVRERLTTAKDVTTKGRGDLVTDVDHAAEQLLVARLQGAFPRHQILAEESGGASGATYTWVIDPIDGTLNYALGIGLFAISVALVKGGAPLLGLVVDPTRGEWFEAERGNGATLNGASIAVSNAETLAGAVVGFDLGHDLSRRLPNMAAATRLMPHLQTLRLIGSAVLALAYVACGRFGAFFHNDLHPWDVAAGQLLIEEAGGVVLRPDGRPAGYQDAAIIAGSPTLTEQLLALLAKG